MLLTPAIPARARDAERCYDAQPLAEPRPQGSGLYLPIAIFKAAIVPVCVLSLTFAGFNRNSGVSKALQPIVIRATPLWWLRRHPPLA